MAGRINLWDAVDIVEKLGDADHIMKGAGPYPRAYRRVFYHTMQDLLERSGRKNFSSYIKYDFMREFRAYAELHLEAATVAKRGSADEDKERGFFDAYTKLINAFDRIPETQ